MVALPRRKRFTQPYQVEYDNVFRQIGQGSFEFRASLSDDNRPAAMQNLTERAAQDVVDLGQPAFHVFAIASQHLVQLNVRVVTVMSLPSPAQRLDDVDDRTFAQIMCIH